MIEPKICGPRPSGLSAGYAAALATIVNEGPFYLVIISFTIIIFYVWLNDDILKRN